MNNQRLVWRGIISLLLGSATLGIIGILATQLPYSPIRDHITDAAALPGGLLASIFYPEGVHTGRGAPSWAVVCMGFNVFVYTLAWFATLSWMNRRNRNAS